VLAGTLTRNEEKFLRDQNIAQFDMPLDSFVEKLTEPAGGHVELAPIG
jgi:hypothetical protein